MVPANMCWSAEHAMTCSRLERDAICTAKQCCRVTCSPTLPGSHVFAQTSNMQRDTAMQHHAGWNNFAYSVSHQVPIQSCSPRVYMLVTQCSCCRVRMYMSAMQT